MQRSSIENCLTCDSVDSWTLMTYDLGLLNRCRALVDLEYSSVLTLTLRSAAIGACVMDRECNVLVLPTFALTSRHEFIRAPVVIASTMHNTVLRKSQISDKPIFLRGHAFLIFHHFIAITSPFIYPSTSPSTYPHDCVCTVQIFSCLWKM